MRRRIVPSLIVAAATGASACSDEPAGAGAPGRPTNVAAAPHNARVTLSWDVVNGAERYNLYWATSAGVTQATGSRLSDVTSPFDHTGLANGTTYFYVVTAENASGESGASAEVSATPANATPTAAAGSDQTAATGVTVTLDGSASDDPDGDPLAYTWTQIGGAPVTLSGATTARPTFGAPRHLDTLRFALTVSDGLIGSPPDSVAITVDRFTQIAIANDVATANSDTETPGKLAAVIVGRHVLVVSCRQAGAPLGLFGTVVDTSGQVLQSFPISPHTCAFPRPSVATDGTGYLVVFQRDGAIVATRLSAAPAYTVAGETTLSSGTSNWSPAVAFGGGAYVVVWNKFGSGPNGHDIYGARVTTTGSTSAEIPVFVQVGEQVSPAIAFDGLNHLVVWRDTRSGSGPSADTDIYGTRVSAGGAVLDTGGIAISTAPNMQGEPHLTFGGGSYFAVWSDARRYALQTQPPLDVFGTRISPAGTLLDGTATDGGIAICTAQVSGGITYYPSAVFDGTRYLVPFSVVGFPPFLLAGIYLARVSTGGALLDRAPGELGPSISGPPPGFSRLVYPVIVSSGLRSVLAWVDNTELSGTAKDIVGVVLDQ